MALQLSLRRVGLLGTIVQKSALLRTSWKDASPLAQLSTAHQSRWASSADVGDVIGIDLGTTNSCVAIMVRFKYPADKNGIAGVTGLFRRRWFSVVIVGMRL